MKTIAIFLFIIMTPTSSFGQKKFKLVSPNIKSLNKIVNQQSNDTDVILLYLENNYKLNSKKYNIKKDSVFNNRVCGYSKKFKHNIIFTTNNCGEATPLIQSITFPKTKTNLLKKWVENIYKASLPINSKPESEWYKGKNEYGPIGGEAGCYYKIQQQPNKSIVEVLCGC